MSGRLPDPLPAAARSLAPPRAAPARPGAQPRPARRGAWKPLAVLAAGTALGLWFTAFVLSRGLDPAAVMAGPWTTWPSVGTPSIDPYARAIQAQTGTVPLAAAEGVAYTADRDDAGGKLDGACTYRIAGPVPPARFWTLTAQTPARGFPAIPAARHGLTSTDLLRREGGAFAVEVAAEARPGNWLPVPAAGPFRLVLRLYETSLGTTPGELGRAAMPTIERLACPPGISGR